MPRGTSSYDRRGSSIYTSVVLNAFYAKPQQPISARSKPKQTLSDFASNLTEIRVAVMFIAIRIHCSEQESILVKLKQ